MIRNIVWVPLFREITIWRFLKTGYLKGPYDSMTQRAAGDSVHLPHGICWHNLTEGSLLTKTDWP